VVVLDTSTHVTDVTAVTELDGKTSVLSRVRGGRGRPTGRTSG
jgi:hypothetical protein